MGRLVRPGGTHAVERAADGAIPRGARPARATARAASSRLRVRARRAVTLIELLAVVGIVGLLVSIALPAIGGARATARASASASNLRQMMTAAEGYAAIFEWMPPAVRYASARDGAGLVEVAWDWTRPLADDGSPDGGVRPGVLWSFTGDPERTLACPAYRPPPGADGALVHTGYNYNTTYVGGEGTFPIPGWDAFRPGVVPARWRRASRVAVFGCGGRAGDGHAGLANRFMRAPSGVEGLGDFTTYSGGQAFRYAGGRTPAAMGDGHVEWFGDPRPGAQATDVALEQFLGFPHNGFLSDDDARYDPR